MGVTLVTRDIPTLSLTPINEDIADCNTLIFNNISILSAEPLSPEVLYQLNNEILLNITKLYGNTTVDIQTLYNIFSQQELLKVLTFNGKITNEFDEFLAYAIAKTNGIMTHTCDTKNEALGKVGI